MPDYVPLKKYDSNSTYNPKENVFDVAAKTLFLTEILRGFWVCLENFMKPPYTINYPFEKTHLSPRFRGEHALRRYTNGNLAFAFSFVLALALSPLDLCDTICYCRRGAMYCV